MVVTVLVNTVSIWLTYPPVNVSRMFLRPRLSVAVTVKRSPPAMSCVSLPVVS
jgi:hypothetical protein